MDSVLQQGTQTGAQGWPVRQENREMVKAQAALMVRFGSSAVQLDQLTASHSEPGEVRAPIEDRKAEKTTVKLQGPIQIGDLEAYRPDGGLRRKSESRGPN